MKMRTTTLGDTGDLSAPPGSPAWAKAVHQDLMYALNDVASDARHVKTMRDLLLKHDGWKQLADRKGRRYLSFTHYCTDKQPFGLGYDPDFLRRILGEGIEALEQQGNGSPTIEEAKDAVLNGHGGDRRSEEFQGVNSTLKTRGSTNSTYLRARLRRDYPDVAAAFDQGDFPSVRAAARAAGIPIKVYLQVPDDADEAAAFFLRRKDREWIAALLAKLAGALT